jgi:hypothetical protein
MFTRIASLASSSSRSRRGLVEQPQPPGIERELRGVDVADQDQRGRVGLAEITQELAVGAHEVSEPDPQVVGLHHVQVVPADGERDEVALARAGDRLDPAPIAAVIDLVPLGAQPPVELRHRAAADDAGVLVDAHAVSEREVDRLHHHGRVAQGSSGTKGGGHAS